MNKTRNCDFISKNLIKNKIFNIFIFFDFNDIIGSFQNLVSENKNPLKI